MNKAQPLVTHRTKIYWILFFMILSRGSFGADLKAFTSDGCSAFPNGTNKQSTLWLTCCTTHDHAYWQGGTYNQRVEADVALQQCVSALGEKEIALLMLTGVRVGGSPFFPTKFRWGYGWPYPKFYGKLSDQELEQIEMTVNPPTSTETAPPLLLLKE